MADGNSFEGIFFVKSAPSVRHEDGLFFICYDVGKVRIEFVMRPNVYLKTRKSAERAYQQFVNRNEGSVSDIKSGSGH